MSNLNLGKISLGLLLVVGCERNQSDLSKDDVAPPKVTMEDVKRDAATSMRTIASYSQQEKDKFIMDMKDQIAKMESEIETLRVKGNSLVGDARASWDRKIALLDEKRRVVADKIEEIGDSTNKAWSDISEGLEAAWEDLSKAFQDAASEF